MPYVQDITLALVRVMDGAVCHKDVRLAGFVPNIEFWADEIRHALDCLRGYKRRFARLKEAREREAARHGIPVEPAWITPSLSDSELERLEKRLHASAAAFMRACAKQTDRATVKRLETLLGFRIEERYYTD